MGGQALVAIPLVTAVVLAGAAVLLIRSAQGSAAVKPIQAGTGEEDPVAPPVADVLVFVSGAVAHPGLYRLAPSARVADAVASAGGILPDADPGRLPDLAAIVHDGRQINVPFRGGGRTSSTAAAKLDINVATTDELAAIPGMPAGLPAAIEEYRQEWGGFSSLSDLTSALGVDAATVRSLRPYLRVGSPLSRATP